jgi:hypothetical protein
MYEMTCKIYKSYNTEIKTTNVLARNLPLQTFNSECKKYADEALKKSIQKIDDQYKYPNNKIKLIAANAFANNKNCNRTIELIFGATTISFSLYLVYSFMKRYRT